MLGGQRLFEVCEESRNHKCGHTQGEGCAHAYEASCEILVETPETVAIRHCHIHSLLFSFCIITCFKKKTMKDRNREWGDEELEGFNTPEYGAHTVSGSEINDTLGCAHAIEWNVEHPLTLFFTIQCSKA